MSKVSIIIPARGESPDNLKRTVDSALNSATGDVELIIGYDGGGILGFPLDSRIKVINFPGVVGIKTNINAMAAMATGKYIYKSDAHCSFGKGFDEILQQDMEPDWIVMPRFKILNGETWGLQERDGQVEYYDYFYLCCPFTDPKGFRFKAGGHWKERTRERDGWISGGSPLGWLDETPQIHGSGWFMERDHYFRLGGFPNVDPHGHAMEPINLALKNWLRGGKVMVNKNTWYAHLHQRGDRRGYHMSKEQENYTYLTTAEHWMGNKEPNLIHDIRWFVGEKFPDMPTWENWEENYRLWEREYK